MIAALEKLNIDIHRWHILIEEILPMFAIDTPERIAMWLGQCAHESASFTRFTESLNYSAAGLIATWPSRYDEELAQEVGRTEEHPADQFRIAQISYGGRGGNDYEQDPWLFKGKGLIQLTFRENYQRFGEVYGMSAEEASEYLDTDEGRIASAAWYFYDRRGLLTCCDEWDIKQATKLINGGYHGLDDRIRKCHIALEELT